MDEPDDLIECKLPGGGNKIGGLFRHAIEAADITAIGDADTQIRVHAAKGIHDRAREGHGLCECRRSELDKLAQ